MRAASRRIQESEGEEGGASEFNENEETAISQR